MDREEDAEELLDIAPEPQASTKRISGVKPSVISSQEAQSSGREEAEEDEISSEVSDELDRTLEDEADSGLDTTLTLLAPHFNIFPDIDSVIRDSEEELEDEESEDDSEDLELIIYSQTTSSELDFPLESGVTTRNTGYTIWDVED